MKKLIIEDRAKFIRFKNRKVRTPVTLLVSDSDLKFLRIQMKMADIQKWRIETKIDEKEKQVIDYDLINKSEIVIEELNEEPKTILEKYMKDENGEQ